MNCGVGCRRGLDPALLWPWCWLAATAPIRPLPWELPYASGAALKKTQDITFINNGKLKKKKKKTQDRKEGRKKEALGAEISSFFKAVRTEYILHGID